MSVVLLQISINKKGEVESKLCLCPRGLDVCHHMATLLLYAHYNFSATDKPREWGPVGKSKAVELTKTVDELFGHKEEYSALKNSEELNITGFKEMLGETSSCTCVSKSSGVKYDSCCNSSSIRASTETGVKERSTSSTLVEGSSSLEYMNTLFPIAICYKLLLPCTCTNCFSLSFFWCQIMFLE